MQIMSSDAVPSVLGLDNDGLIMIERGRQLSDVFVCLGWVNVADNGHAIVDSAVKETESRIIRRLGEKVPERPVEKMEARHQSNHNPMRGRASGLSAETQFPGWLLYSMGLADAEFHHQNPLFSLEKYCSRHGSKALSAIQSRHAS
jgi:hypothetical protein